MMLRFTFIAKSFFLVLLLVVCCFFAVKGKEVKLSYSGLYEADPTEREPLTIDEQTEVETVVKELILSEKTSTVQYNFKDIVLITKKLMYYTYSQENSKDFTVYKKDERGAVIGTEQFVFARVYNIEAIVEHLNSESKEGRFYKHIARLWKDIDTKYFLNSHYFSPVENTLKPEYDSSQTTKGDSPQVDAVDVVIGDLSDNSLKSEENATRSEHQSSENLKIVSYNIWNFNDPWELRAPLIVDFALSAGADIIAFQEVRCDIVREYRKFKIFNEVVKRFQVDELKSQIRNSKYHRSEDEWQYIYSPAMNYLEINRGDFRTDEGLAIFSRFPIVSHATLLLSRDSYDSDDVHQRIVQMAQVDTGKWGKFCVFNSHFSLSENAQKRAVKEIMEWIEQFPTPHIFLGDLNAEPHYNSIQFLTGKIRINGQTGDFVDLWENYQLNSLHSQIIPEDDSKGIREDESNDLRSIVSEVENKDDDASSHDNVIKDIVNIKVKNNIYVTKDQRIPMIDDRNTKSENSNSNSPTTEGEQISIGEIADGGDEIEVLRPLYQFTDPGFTFFTWELKKRIDFALFRGDLNQFNIPSVNTIGCEGISHAAGKSNNDDGKLYASDHCGIVVNFELKH